MKKYSKILLIAVIIISLFGTLMIYSSSYVWAEYKFNDPYKYLKSQSIFLILGYIVMFIVSKFPYQNYKKLSNIIFFICLGMLALVLIPGIGTVRNGSRSWFGIGGLGVQPSEFTKLGLIIFTSKYLENNKIRVKYPEKVKAVTPGQACVLYLGEECLGCGFIDTVKNNEEYLWYLHN